MFYPRKTKINIRETKRKINKNWCWRRRDPMGIFVLVGSKCPQQRVDAIKWGPKTLRASASGGALRCLLRNTVNFSTSAPGWEAFNFSLLTKRSHYLYPIITLWTLPLLTPLPLCSLYSVLSLSDSALSLPSLLYSFPSPALRSWSQNFFAPFLWLEII